MELEVDEIGPSLRYATAKVNRAQRTDGGGSPGGYGGSGSRPTPPADDPWSSAPPAGGAAGYSDEPPF